MEHFSRFFYYLNAKGAVKYGVIRNGEVICKPIYNETVGFDDYEEEDYGDMTHFGIVRKGRKWGVIDSSLREVLPLIYDRIYSGSVKSMHYSVVLDGKRGLFTFMGEEVIPVEYDQIDCKYSLARVRKGDVWSYLDLSEEGKARPIDGAALEAHGMYATFQKDIEHDEARSKKSAAFVEKCKRYDRVLDSQNYDVHVVKKGRKYGCVNRDGDEIIPAKYQQIRILYFNERLLVTQEDQYAYFDYEGRQITSTFYLWTEGFVEDRAMVLFGDVNSRCYYGYIDIDGKQRTFINYDDVEEYCNSRARVQIDDKWGFIDLDGAELTPLKYTSLGDYNSNTAVYEIDGKYGLIDYDGVEITPPLYDRITIFGENRVLKVQSRRSAYSGDEYGVVQKDGKLGLINMRGEALTPIIYDSIYSIVDGYMQVQIGNKIGLIDREGREFLPVKYSEINQNIWSFLAVKYRGKWAIVNHEGKRVTKFIFDDITSGAIVTLNGKTYQANKYGEICDKSVGSSLTYDYESQICELDWRKV